MVGSVHRIDRGARDGAAFDERFYQSSSSTSPTPQGFLAPHAYVPPANISQEPKPVGTLGALQVPQGKGEAKPQDPRKLVRAQIERRLQKQTRQSDELGEQALRAAGLENLLEDYRAYGTEDVVVAFRKRSVHGRRDPLVKFTLSLSEYAAQRASEYLPAAPEGKPRYVGLFTPRAPRRSFAPLLDSIEVARDCFKAPSSLRAKAYAQEHFLLQEREIFALGYKKPERSIQADVYASAIAASAGYGAAEQALGRHIPWVSQGVGIRTSLDALGFNYLSRIAFGFVSGTQASDPTEKFRKDLEWSSDRSACNHRCALLALAHEANEYSGRVVDRSVGESLLRDYAEGDLIDYWISYGMVDYLASSRPDDWARLCMAWQAGDDWRLAWIEVLGCGEIRDHFDQLGVQHDALTKQEHERGISSMYQAVSEKLASDFWHWVRTEYPRRNSQSEIAPYHPGKELRAPS